jgi:hypothetical protein
MSAVHLIIAARKHHRAQADAAAKAKGAATANPGDAFEASALRKFGAGKDRSVAADDSAATPPDATAGGGGSSSNGRRMPGGGERKTLSGERYLARRSVSSAGSFMEALVAPDTRRRALDLLCGTPTVVLLLLAILISAIPSSAVDVFWTNHLTLQMFDEVEQRLHPNAWAGRGKRAKRLYLEHVNLRRDALFSASTRKATLVMVTIQVGSAVGQVLGAALGVWYSYSPLSYRRTAAPSSAKHAPCKEPLGDAVAAPPVAAAEKVNRQGLYAAMVLVGFLTPLPFLYLLGPAPPVHGHYVWPYILLDFLGGSCAFFWGGSCGSGGSGGGGGGC